MYKLNASDNHFSTIRTVCAEIIRRDPMSGDHHMVTCEPANMDVSLKIATELMSPWGFDVVGQPSGRISIRPVVKTRDTRDTYSS